MWLYAIIEREKKSLIKTSTISDMRLREQLLNNLTGFFIFYRQYFFNLRNYFSNFTHKRQASLPLFYKARFKYNKYKLMNRTSKKRNIGFLEYLNRNKNIIFQKTKNNKKSDKK